MGRLLTILKIDEKTQSKLPPDVLKGEKLLEALQTVYANSPESPKKNQLALAISESVRILLAKVQPYMIKEEQEKKIEEEEKKLPDEKRQEIPKEKPQAKPEQRPEQKQERPEMPPQPKRSKAKPPKEEPPKKVEEEPMTCEEIKSAIKGLSLLVKMGDDEAKDIVKLLKIKLKNQNC